LHLPSPARRDGKFPAVSGLPDSLMPSFSVGPLVATDDIILWTAFATGIIGTVLAAASFLWQLIQWRSGLKDRSITTLNNRVLKPWSDIAITWVPGWPNGIELRVPKSEFPSGTSGVPEDGLRFRDIPGARSALDYLTLNRPDVVEAWYKMTNALDQYDAARNQRHRLVETVATAAMSAAYPRLSAWNGVGAAPLDCYSLPAVITVVEARSYRDVEYEFSPVQVTTTRMDMGNGNLRYSLGDPNYVSLLVGVQQSEADEEKLASLLSKWIQNQEVYELNRSMLKHRKELEDALKPFKAKLKEVCLRIEQSGG